MRAEWLSAGQRLNAAGRQGFVGCGYPVLLQAKHMLSYGWTQTADPKKAVPCVGDGSLLFLYFLIFIE